MIASAIRFLVQNLPAVLFLLALLIAAATRRDGPIAERLLSWTLLLPIGVTGRWAGSFHVFLPKTAASLIGWQVSPFQFEGRLRDRRYSLPRIFARREFQGGSGLCCIRLPVG